MLGTLQAQKLIGSLERLRPIDAPARNLPTSPISVVPTVVDEEVGSSNSCEESVRVRDSEHAESAAVRRATAKEKVGQGAPERATTSDGRSAPPFASNYAAGANGRDRSAPLPSATAAQGLPSGLKTFSHDRLQHPTETPLATTVARVEELRAQWRTQYTSSHTAANRTAAEGADKEVRGLV